MPGIPIKWIIIGLLFVAVATAVGLGYNHYNNLVKENVTLHENAAKLQAVIETQKATIAAAEENARAWKSSFDKWQQTLSSLVDVNQQAMQQLDRLNRTFAKHDLARLAAAKPLLIERSINRGTADALVLFERATSGSQDGSDQSGTSAGTSQDTEPESGKAEASRVEGADKGDNAKR